MSSTPSLHELATAAGLAPHWIDAGGQPQQVSDEALQRLLGALGFPAASPAQRSDSTARINENAQVLPTLITADIDTPIALPTALQGQTLAIRDEHGAVVSLRGVLAPSEPGYYTLEHNGGEITLAISPPRCFGVADALGQQPPRAWGLAAQVYSLSRHGDGGSGDSSAVAALCGQAATAGADALGLSPLHAIGPIIERYSPYSPSHRGFFNPWLTDPAHVVGEAAVREALQRAGIVQAWQQQESAPLIDWPAVAALRQTLWETLYALLPSLPQALQDDYQTFVAHGGDALDAHALMAAGQLDAARRGQSCGWRDWSGDWQSAAAPAARQFALANADALALERFRQWLATRSWRAVQSQARDQGMGIGLVADLAVGFDPGGGEAWVHRQSLLHGLALGAPPDALAPQGQQWGITSYSPHGLRNQAFAPFLRTLRANMAVGGGLRLDHILGLARLWVVPESLPASEGGYLRYPLDDLLRLVALESWRNRCIVIGEDLGTVPETLRVTLAKRGVMGTDVMLFCRDDRGAFVPSPQWRTDAMATTTTHDLPPLRGWRQGADLIEHARLQGTPLAETESALAQRRADVNQLDAQLGHMPKIGPPPRDDAAAPDLASIRFVARSAATLVLIPMEDLLGRTEQPNLPGTVDEHPNWRLRLPRPEAQGKMAATLAWIAQARREATHRDTSEPASHE